MAPRTDEPTRISGWFRVARTTSTTPARNGWGTGGPSAAAPSRWACTMDASSAALW